MFENLHNLINNSKAYDNNDLNKVINLMGIDDDILLYTDSQIDALLIQALSEKRHALKVDLIAKATSLLEFNAQELAQDIASADYYER